MAVAVRMRRARWLVLILAVLTVATDVLWQHDCDMAEQHQAYVVYSSIAQVGYLMVGVLTAMHYFASDKGLTINPTRRCTNEGVIGSVGTGAC